MAISGDVENMLVLRRREGEGLELGEDITVVVTRIEKNQIHLGITAPRSVYVLRSELVGRDRDITYLDKHRLAKPQTPSDSVTLSRKNYDSLLNLSRLMADELRTMVKEEKSLQRNQSALGDTQTLLQGWEKFEQRYQAMYP